MSSSGYHPPPHLHRVNIQSHGKRPFEEYDSDPSDANMPIQPTTASGTSSSSSHRFPSPAGPETRNKRARSTSSTSTDDSSNPSSSSGYNTAQSSSRSDIFADGPAALPANQLDCPVASPPSFTATQDVHMSDLHLPMPPSLPQRSRVPSPPTPEDSLRSSLQRFADFDRQIAALRTSLAATRSSPLPTSLDGDPSPSNSHWQSSFLSDPTPPSTVAVAPSDTLNSVSTFASNDSANNNASSTTLPSPSFNSNYGNPPRYPPYHSSYRPSIGGSSSLAGHERVGDVASSSSVPAIMRPSSNENTTRVPARSSVSVESSIVPSTSHIRHVRRSLSPLVFPPDPSPSSSLSIVTDDILLRYRTPYVDRDTINGRSHRRGVDSPLPTLDHEVSSSRMEDHFGEQLPGWSSQNRLGDRVRVIREHSVERESVPSVFDVFNIGESNRNRPSPVRDSATSRYTPVAEPVPPRVPTNQNERPRPAPITAPINPNQGPSQDLPARLHSSWTSIPSSNSLMSESASERRHAAALERFRTRIRRSSLDGDDESDSRWSGSSRGEREREREGGVDLGVTSPVPPSPSVESAGTNFQFPSFGTTRAPPSTTNRAEPATSMPLQRSFSELLAETQRIAREEGAEAWLLDWESTREAERERLLERDRERQLERERQRERVWEWERERQRERSSQDVRGRGFASGSSLASTSSTREESAHGPLLSAPPRPTTGQPAGPNVTVASTTNNNQQYSYGNLNLSSFQSGLFRDSLRRNAEVDQTSLSTNGPGATSSSHIVFEDESDMDMDEFVPASPPSPEWSRPHPYAGRTPPPSPPPRSLNLRPGFTVLRRGNLVTYDAQPRPNRSSTMFTRPIPMTPSGPTRATSYENNNNRSAPPERTTQRDRFLPARILESIHRAHENGERSASAGTWQPYNPQPPNQSHMMAPSSSTVSRNDVAGGPRSASVGGNGNGNGNGSRPGPEGMSENRRGSFGLGGSIRSRLARFANPQSSASNGSDAPASQPRSPSRPVGARPQTEPHRRSTMFGNGEHEVRAEARSVPGAPHWAVSAGTAEPSVVTRDAPWRAPSGSRNVFAPPPRNDASDVMASRVEEHRSRLRTLRQRLQLDRAGEGVRVFRPGMLRAAMGRRGNLGDYMPDELFDDSYEALLSLSSMLGEARSRATPEEVIASLPTGTFKEWKKEDSETRCPICLDDYEPSDAVTKLIECPHWLHKNCLEQWLRTANTCPVCREKVKASPKPAPARRRAQRDFSEQTPGSSTSGNGSNGRPPQTGQPSNNGRAGAFASMVFDRLMNEGREVTVETWTPSASSSAQGAPPPPARDARTVFLERLRAQQQQHAGLQEAPYPLRVPPTSQPGSASSRPFGFVPLLREQGSSDSSQSTAASSSISFAEDAAGGRRTMGGSSGGSASGSGSFFDAPVMPRREGVGAFPLVPPSSSTFASASGGPAFPPPPPPPPPPVQPLPTNFDGHGHGRQPTMMLNSSEPARRMPRGYPDGMVNAEASRSSSSSSGSVSRPMGVVNRIPVEEDSPFEDYVFGWRFQNWGGRGHGHGDAP